MTNMRLQFTLDDTLSRLGISSRKLAELTGIRKNTILDLRKGTISRIPVEVIETLLSFLNEHDPNNTYDISDIFVYKAASE